MKLNLETDEVVSKDSSYTDMTVYRYKSGGFAVLINEGSVLYPIGSVKIIYNTGDMVELVPDGDEYRLVYILTHDGITWSEEKTTSPSVSNV